jgi:hypothetical protein
MLFPTDLRAVKTGIDTFSSMIGHFDVLWKVAMGMKSDSSHGPTWTNILKDSI